MKKAAILRSIVVLVFSITLVSCSTEDAPQTPSAQPTIELKNYNQSTFEIELLDLVNQDRVSKGLSALSIINQISYVASTHDDYMITAGAISHDNFDTRVASLKNGIGALSVTENVAAGYNTPAATLAAWNASPAHKANLEGNHTHFGLSVKSDANGKKYYTLMFIRK